MPSITFPSGSILAPTVKNLSADVSSIYSTLCAHSANWSSASSLSGLTGNWNNVYNSVNSLSDGWSSAYTTLKDVSGNYSKSLTWVENNSSTMFVDRLGVNTNISNLSNDLKVAINGDTVVYGNLSSLGTTTLINVTANTTDALSVVNPGFGSPNAIYIQQGGPGAAIRIQNIGSGPLMALEGNGNVGIGTSIPNVKLTVSGHVSSTGIIYASSGNSDIWNLGTSIIAAYSGNWDSNYTTSKNYSGKWTTSYNFLTSSSGNWNSLYNNVSSFSGTWSNVFSTVSATSAVWNSAATTLASKSANWDATNQLSQLLSSEWTNAYSTTKAYSALWSSASINYIIDGAGNNITTGSKGCIFMPSKFKVTSWRVLADTIVNSLEVDIRRFPNGSYKIGSLSSDSLFFDINTNTVNDFTILNSSSATGGTIQSDISANDTLEFYISNIDGNAKRIVVVLAGLKSI